MSVGSALSLAELGVNRPPAWEPGVGETPPGERKNVEVEGRVISEFNVNGTFIAVLNVCPHEFAPICLGQLDDTTLPSSVSEFRWGREGEILACLCTGGSSIYVLGKG